MRPLHLPKSLSRRPPHVHLHRGWCLVALSPLNVGNLIGGGLTLRQREFVYVDLVKVSICISCVFLSVPLCLCLQLLFTISCFIFVNSTLPLPVFVFFPSFGIVFPAHIGFTWALFQEAGSANNYEFVEHASWNRALLLVYILGPHEYLAIHLSICLVSPPVRFSSHVLTHSPVDFIRSLLFQ